MSKKAKIFIAIGAAIIFLAALIFFIVNKTGSTPATGSVSNIDIIGTWYSDKPDSVTFTEDGKYSFAAWNGGNPWLTFAGTFTINHTDNGDSVTLQSTQDGTTSLTVTYADNGSMILSGKYNYYKTEDAAKAALEAAEDKAAEDAANIIPNTVNKLVGEWTSLDGTTTCTFTETGITVHFLGNSAVAEDTLYYEYEVISDKQIKISKSGAAATYPYTLTEKDGTTTFYCTAIEYAPTYTKNNGQEQSSTGSAGDSSTTTVVTDRVISSEKNPDKGEYTAELSSYVNEMLLGTWKGTFDEWPNADSTYWSYTFTGDGKYTFSNGSTEESGTYSVTSDPNNNYYHSSMELTYDGGSRTVQFYFTTTDPVKMITDDQSDPTFLKS